MIKKSLMQFGDKDFGSEAQPFDFGCNEKGEHAFALDGVELTKEKIEEIGKGGSGGVQPTTEPYKLYGTDDSGEPALYNAYTDDTSNTYITDLKQDAYYIPVSNWNSFYVPIVVQDFTDTYGAVIRYSLESNSFKLRFTSKNNSPNLDEGVFTIVFPEVYKNELYFTYGFALPHNDSCTLMGVYTATSIPNGNILCYKEEYDENDNEVYRQWLEDSGLNAKDIITQSKLNTFLPHRHLLSLSDENATSAISWETISGEPDKYTFLNISSAFQTGYTNCRYSDSGKQKLGTIISIVAAEGPNYTASILDIEGNLKQVVVSKMTDNVSLA